MAHAAAQSAHVHGRLGAGRRFYLDVALFAVAGIGILAAMPRRVGDYDEGLILTGAMRVAAGELPHTDFYANYGPAQFYALAFLFKLFGPSVMIERLWDAGIKALIATLSFAAVRRWCGYRTALAAYGCAVIWLAALGFPGFPLFPALLFSLAALLLIQPALELEGTPLSVFAGGVCAGLAALFRYDVGAATCLVLLTTLATRSPVGTGNRKSIVLTCARFLLGASAAVVPVAVLYLAFGGSIPALIEDIAFNLRNYPLMRSLPFPSASDVWADPARAILYLAPMILLLSIVSLWIPASDENAPGPRAIISFAGIGAVFFLKGWVRVSAIHMVGAIVFAITLLPMVWRRLEGHSGGRIARVWCAVGLAVTTWFAAAAAADAISANRQLAVASLFRNRAGTGPCGTPAHLTRMRCFSAEDSWSEAVKFVADRLPANERLLVGLTRHDKVFVNDNLIYFVTGRLPATKWHHYDPGLQTRADIQAEMARELEKQCPRLILLASTWDNMNEPNASALSSGVTILDDYIRSHYAVIRQFGTISALERHDCGASP